MNIINLYDNYTLKIVAYYNFQGEVANGVTHPRVEELNNYLEKNIKVNKLEFFYQKIIDNCKFFPTKKELSEIYGACFGQEAKLYKDAIEFQEIEKKYNKTVEGVNIQTAIADSKILSADLMLKKYGIKICTEIWLEEGREEYRKLREKQEEKIKAENMKAEKIKNENVYYIKNDDDEIIHVSNYFKNLSA